MSDWLKDIEQARMKAVLEVGLNVGDFVGVLGQYAEVWHEVQSAPFEGSKFFGMWDRDGKTTLALLGNVVRIHRKGDPWDFGELRYAMTSRGQFGYKDGQPIPDDLRYQGACWLKLWGWHWRGSPYLLNNTPKCPKDIEPWMKAAGISGRNIPWDQVAKEAKRVSEIKINGWWPVFTWEAETVFGKTIEIKDPLK